MKSIILKAYCNVYQLLQHFLEKLLLLCHRKTPMNMYILLMMILESVLLLYKNNDKNSRKYLSSEK